MCAKISDLLFDLKFSIKSLTLVGFGPNDDFGQILESVAKFEKLESLMLDTVHIEDARDTLGQIFTNIPLKALTIRVENLKIIAEHFSTEISKLPLRVLRLSGNLYLNSEKILDTLEGLKLTLVDLMLEGNWVNDGFISKLPKMARLEAIRIVPGRNNIGTISNRISTSVVLDFAGKCPVLVEPRFLRNVKILQEISRDEPDSPYHPDWRVYCQSGSRPMGPTAF